MSFVAPLLAAAGVAAMAIPILIHLLFRQRRRPVMWAAMQLLMEAYRRRRTRLRLQQFILLALRCSAVALAGLALAQPLVRAAGIIEGAGSRTIFLVIDNGLISGLVREDGATSLEKHIATATEIVNSLGPGDRVGVILAANPAKSLLDPPSGDLSAVRRLLETIKPSETASDIEGALQRLDVAAQEQSRSSGASAAYLLSDLRRGSAPLERILSASGDESRLMRFALVPASDSITDIQVREIEPLRAVILPGQTDGSGQVTVRLARSGEVLPADITRVRLAGEGVRALPAKTVRWAEGQTEAATEFTVTLVDSSDQDVALTASIDSDPLPADNTRYLVLESRSQIRVAMVDVRRFGAAASVEGLTAGQWMRWALRPTDQTPIDLVEIEPAAADSRTFRLVDIVVVARPDLLTDQGWSDLRTFVDRGGFVIITPPGDAGIHLWSDHLTRSLGLPWEIKIESMKAEEGIGLAESADRAGPLHMISAELLDLVRPIRVYQWLLVSGLHSDSDRILSLSNGDPMLIKGSPTQEKEGTSSRGTVLVFTVAPELSWTNLPTKPLMVPLVQEIVREELGEVRSARSSIVGARAGIFGGRLGQSAAKLLGPDDRAIAIDQQGRTEEPLDHAGIYRAVDAAGQIVGRLRVNIDSSAAETQIQAPEAVLAWLRGNAEWSYLDPADPAASLRNAAAESPLSGIILPIVLGLLIIEAILAGLWSPRTRAQAPGLPALSRRKAAA